MAIWMEIKAMEAPRRRLIRLIVLIVVSLWVPSVVANDMTSLVCSGILSTPGKESPIVGATVSVREDGIGVSGISPFDGKYIVTASREDLIFFGLDGGEEKPSVEYQGNMNRVSGKLTLMNVSWSDDAPPTMEKWKWQFVGSCVPAKPMF